MSGIFIPTDTQELLLSIMYSKVCSPQLLPKSLYCLLCQVYSTQLLPKSLFYLLCQEYATQLSPEGLSL